MQTHTLPDTLTDSPSPLEAAQQRIRELETQLAEAQTQLRQVIEYIPMSVAMFDTTMRYLQANTAWSNAYHLDDQRLIGRSHYEVFPEIGDDWKEIHQRCLAGEINQSDQAPFPRADGSLDWIRWDVRPWYHADDTVGGLLMYTEVITQQVETQESLKRSEQMLREVLNTIPVRVFWKDHESRYLGASRLFTQDMGITSLDELIGKTDADFFPPQIAAHFHATDRTILETGESIPTTIEYTPMPNGTAGWFEGSKFPLKNMQGEIMGILGVFIEISQRKQQAMMLEAKYQEEQQFQQYLTSLHEISLQLTMIDNLDEFYRRTIKFALEYFGIDRVGMWLHDHTRNQAVGTYGTDLNGQLQSEHHLQFELESRPSLLRSIQSQERLIYEDGVELYHNMLPVGTGWRIIIALESGSRNLGWLSFDNLVRGLPISHSQLTVLSQYGLLIASLLARKQLETELRESEARYRLLVTHLPDMTAALYDHDLRFILVDGSDPAIRNSRIAFEHRTIHDIVSPTIAAQFEPLMRAALKGEKQGFEFTSPHTEQTFKLIFVPVKNTHGDILNAMVLAQNITEQKKAGAALHDSQERFMLAMEGSDAGYWDWDIPNDKVYFSPRWKSMIGYADHELSNVFNTWVAHIHPQDEARVMHILLTFLESRNDLYAVEYRLRHKDGSYRWVLAHGKALRDAQGTAYRMSGSHTDITALKQSEETLRNREALYRTLLTNLPKIALVVYDRKMRFMLADGAELPHLGYDQSHMIGKQLEETSTPQDPQIVREAVQNTFDGEIITYEMTYHHEQYQVTYVPIFNEDNEIANVMELIQNITERKKAEIALCESEARYRMLAANLPDMTVALYDHDLRFLLVDGLDAGSSGLQKAHEGHTLYEATTPAVIALFEPLMRAALNGERVVREVGSPTDGQTFLLIFTPIKNDAGQIVNGLALSQNITDRRIAEEEWQRLFYQTETLYNLSRTLRDSRTPQEVVQAIYDVLPTKGRKSLDLNYFDDNLTGSKQLTHSELVAQIYEGAGALPLYSRFEINQFSISEILLNSDSAIIIEDIETDQRIEGIAHQMLHAANIKSLIFLPLKVNERIEGFLSLSYFDMPHKFNRGELALWQSMSSLVSPVIANLRLLDHLERSIEALKLAKRAAEESSRLKSEFLSTMSHELRTPLNAIEGFTSIMLSGMGIELEPRARNMIERVGANSKRLLHLINDILDLSRIEAGRTELTITKLSPRKLAKKWQNEVSILAEKKGLALRLEIEPSMPDSLYSDEDVLTKVVQNLLTNAIKFTNTGSVTLKMTAGEQLWSVSVADTGVGIPDHAHDYIFDEFRQVDGSSKRLYGGTGLGLAIVKKLVRLLGGKITLESEVGQGSIFIVTLPLVTEMR